MTAPLHSHLGNRVRCHYLRKKRKKERGVWPWWLMAIIPALWEAKTAGSQGQEIETILVNMVKPRLY